MASNPVGDVLSSAQLASRNAAVVASDPLSSFAVAVQSLSALEESFEGVEIVAVLLNEDYDEKGNEYDVVDVSFRIRGRPGIFTVHPSFDINWQAQAFFQIGIKHAQVEGIYQGARNSAEAPIVTTPGGVPFEPRPVVPLGGVGIV